MKEKSREKLQDAIGMIDEDLLNVPARDRAQRPADIRKAKKRSWFIGGVTAAAVAIMTVATLLLATAGNGSPKNYIVRHIDSGTANKVGATTEAAMDETGVYTEDTWNNMTNVERYRELTYNGATYGFCLIAIHRENLGEPIGTAVARGQDYYTEEVRELEVQAYTIRGMDPGYAITVQLEPGSEYTHAFLNYGAFPATLDELEEALNLSEFLTVGNAYYTDEDGQEVVYENISTDKVLELLDKYATAENARDLTGSFMVNRAISISANIRVLGIENRALTLTMDGYLWTNMLDYANFFYIGEDAVNDFVSYVTGNYQGYIYVYDSDGDAVPETEDISPDLVTETTAAITTE